jgi:hypothetical protein
MFAWNELHPASLPLLVFHHPVAHPRSLPIGRPWRFTSAASCSVWGRSPFRDHPASGASLPHFPATHAHCDNPALGRLGERVGGGEGGRLTSDAGLCGGPEDLCCRLVGSCSEVRGPRPRLHFPPPVHFPTWPRLHSSPALSSLLVPSPSLSRIRACTQARTHTCAERSRRSLRQG